MDARRVWGFVGCEDARGGKGKHARGAPRMATPSGRSAHFGRFRTHIPARVGVCPSVPPIPSHARRGVGFCRVGPRDRSTRARGVVICQHRRPDAAPTSANCHARSWVGKLGEPLPTPRPVYRPFGRYTPSPVGARANRYGANRTAPSRSPANFGQVPRERRCRSVQLANSRARVGVSLSVAWPGRCGRIAFASVPPFRRTEIARRSPFSGFRKSPQRSRRRSGVTQDGRRAKSSPAGAHGGRRG